MCGSEGEEGEAMLYQQRVVCILADSARQTLGNFPHTYYGAHINKQQMSSVVGCQVTTKSAEGFLGL